MKKDKNFYLSLLVFIGAPIVIVVGIVMAATCKNNRLVALGGLLVCLGALILLMGGGRLLSVRAVNKEKREKQEKALIERQNLIDEARQEFIHKTHYPKANTIKIVKDKIVFFAEGRYVCEKDFKGKPGHHLAFEISSTSLKYMPEDYDDVCDLEHAGVLISVGYFDGEPFAELEIDNGVILPDTLENSVDKTITLTRDGGYLANIWTVEGDDVDYGFIKILKCEADVLTVFFSLTVSYGLCDTVEGVVELKKDTGDGAQDIHSLISRIKRKMYNTIEVSAEEVQEIKQDNPFLPESYITFLSEVGFADLDWIDIGWNTKTPTNLDDDQTGYVRDIIKDYKRNVNDYYFIGIDSSDSYYALSKNADDKKVYILSNDASEIGTYATFEEFLREILSV